MTRQKKTQQVTMTSSRDLNGNDHHPQVKRVKIDLSQGEEKHDLGSVRFICVFNLLLLI